VVEHVGRGFHHNLDGRALALEIGCQHFDAAARNALADGADGQSEQFRAAVGAVVAVDAGETANFRPMAPRSGHALRLIVIHGSGAPFSTAQNPQRRVHTFPGS